MPEKDNKSTIIIRNIATLYGLGRYPFPGVVGTLFGLILGLLIKIIIPYPYYAIFIVSLVVVIFYIFKKYGEELLKGDPKEVVLDETVGFLLMTIFLTQPIYYLLAFIFFRLFDNLKPYPINLVENSSSLPFRVFLDDIIAGLYSIIVIILLQNIV